MLLERRELDRFKSLVTDIRRGLLPRNIEGAALSVFAAENPHLFMTADFREHMRRPWPARLEGRTLGSVVPDVFAFGGKFQGHPEASDFDFRTATGRWGTLLGVPDLHSEREHNWAFFFVLGSRRTINESVAWLSSSGPEEEYERAVDELWQRDIIRLPLDALLAHLDECVSRPREQRSVLWSPRLWTPGEQARQRRLLDTSLSPHLDKWRTTDVCLDDLNASEFEDLVGQVLLSAGLQVYKVREAPQGGRDLVARGSLIPGEEPIEIAVEVKHRRVVDRPDVQLALYQNRDYPALIFVTSGRFTAGVFRERDNNRFRLFLKDGLAVGDLVRVHFRLPVR